MFENCGTAEKPLVVKYTPGKWTLDTTKDFEDAVNLEWVTEF